MSDNFMNENFWDEDSTVNDGMTLRGAWNAAVSKLSDHLVKTTTLGGTKRAFDAAAQRMMQDNVVAIMVYNPATTKAESADDVAGDYLKSDDLAETIAIHAKFCGEVRQGARFKKPGAKKSPTPRR